METELLVITNRPDSAWVREVRETLGGLGDVRVASEQAALEQVTAKDYDLIIIDSTAIGGDLPTLISELHSEQPDIPIVVATMSPTWQRARQAFLAGATDYIRKSFDRERILAIAQEVLERSVLVSRYGEEPKEDDHFQGDDLAG